ncbi:MAG: ABC transporter substrate-binding protein [Firmicutes bacterium]|nr:ABC transporter substrate-binding protein [Bacillota bacterium]
MKQIKVWICHILLFLTMPLTACSQQGHSVSYNGPDFSTLSFEKEECLYANQFEIEKEDGYTLLHIDQDTYLIVEEGKEIPRSLDPEITIIKKPLKNSYLVSTSVMDYLCQLDCLDSLRFSGTRESDWYIDKAKEEMNTGNLLYAGKYSAPDYELLLSAGCDLAIENTMIYHNPAVKEKLEELGIPVLVERSSYEAHPLARLEWIKVYGLLFGKEEEANSFFLEQVQEMESILQKENTGKRIAFFSITSNGSITVRKPNDYISTMISLAGGEYVLKDLRVEEENALSTMHMQMEDFYAQAIDADILIYNATIEGEIHSIQDLIQKENLFKDFKAVKNKKVYCTSQNFFQKSTGMAQFMKDIDAIVHEDSNDCIYLIPLS